MATFNLKSLLTFSVGLGSCFWIADAMLNVYVFKNGQSLSESFFSPTLSSLWMRFSIITVVIIFYVCTKKYSAEQQEQIEELEYLVTIDPTTLLFNKRKLFEILEYEIEKDKRYKLGMSVIFCDIDDINNISKSNSKKVMKKFLRAFSTQLITTLRKSDVVARFGENGFLVLIPNKTAFNAQLISGKIKTAIEKHDFENIGKITVSFGITQLIENDNKVTIIQRASDAFNKAKEKGPGEIEIVL